MSGFNAYDFKKQYIDSQPEGTFFKTMSAELNYYFFSHMHDVQVILFSKTDIITHFFDFFNYLCLYGDGSDISRSYAAYYQEISKQRTDVQSYIWSIFYSFASLMEASAELRAIRFSIEKSESLDLVKFFQHVKNMIATVLSINFEILVMDNLTIDPIDLSQVFTAIYEKKVISKIHLLDRISTRAGKKGIIASELSVVLISDFVKERRKKNALSNKPKIDFSEFFPKNNRGNTPKKINVPKLNFNRDDQENEEQNQQKRELTSAEKIKMGFISKKKRKRKGHKELLVDTRKDLQKQMNYIIKEKAKTEERLINGTALLRKSLIEYNRLLEFSKAMKNNLFDVYFKIKINDVSRNLPIEDKELLLFRSLDKRLKRSLFKEVGDINESELLLESFHDREEKKPKKR